MSSLEPTLRSRILVPDHVLHRELEDEMVFLNLEDQSYLGLDPVGARIWKALLGAGSVREALTELENVYEVGSSELESDVLRLIRELIEHGLVDLAVDDV